MKSRSSMRIRGKSTQILAYSIAIRAHSGRDLEMYTDFLRRRSSKNFATEFHGQSIILTDVLIQHQIGFHGVELLWGMRLVAEAVEIAVGGG